VNCHLGLTRDRDTHAVLQPGFNLLRRNARTPARVIAIALSYENIGARPSDFSDRALIWGRIADRRDESPQGSQFVCRFRFLFIRRLSIRLHAIWREDLRRAPKHSTP